MATWGGDPYFRDWTDEEKQNLFEITRLLVELGSRRQFGRRARMDGSARGRLQGSGCRRPVSRRTAAHDIEVFDEYGQTPLSIANAVITVGSKDAYYQSSRVVRKSTSDLLLKLGARPLAESGVQILDLFYKQP